MTSHQLSGLVQSGALTRLRRGVFIRKERWEASRPDERYRELVRSLRFTSQRGLTVCRQSAAVLHGLPLIGEVPARVHALDPDARGGSSNRFLVSHRSEPEDPDSVVIDGLRVTSLARTVIDLAIHTPMAASVAALDHGFRAAEQLRSAPGHWTTHPTPAQLLMMLGELAPRRGGRRAAEAIAFASPGSMSPGESVSRVQMHLLGFEIPELQHRFVLDDGRTADTDFWWPSVRAIGEFDGDLKYLDARFRSGRSADQVLLREKRREDDLRRQSDRFLRWDWRCAMDSVQFGTLLAAHGIPRR